MAYVTGREHEGGFWGAGNILFYDLGVGSPLLPCPGLADRGRHRLEENEVFPSRLKIMDFGWHLWLACDMFTAETDFATTC